MIPTTSRYRHVSEVVVEEEPIVFTTALVLFDPSASPIDVSEIILPTVPVDNLCFSVEVLEAFSLWSACLVFFKQAVLLLDDSSSLGYLFGAIKRARSKLLTKAVNLCDNLVVLDAVGTVTSRRHTAVLQT